MIAAMRKSKSARRCTGISRQIGNAAAAAAIAFFASSTVALEVLPTTCRICDGFTDSIVFAAEIFFPPITSGYVSPSFLLTSSIACFIRARFSSTLKSISGSFLNSRTVFCITGTFFRLNNSTGFISNSSTGTFSKNPARRNDAFEVFSKSRLTRYAIPGKISPNGVYTRTRCPRSIKADLIGSAIPYSI